MQTMFNHFSPSWCSRYDHARKGCSPHQDFWKATRVQHRAKSLVRISWKEAQNGFFSPCLKTRTPARSTAKQRAANRPSSPRRAALPSCKSPSLHTARYGDLRSPPLRARWHGHGELGAHAHRLGDPTGIEAPQEAARFREISSDTFRDIVRPSNPVRRHTQTPDRVCAYGRVHHSHAGQSLLACPGGGWFHAGGRFSRRVVSWCARQGYTFKRACFIGPIPRSCRLRSRQHPHRRPSIRP